MNKSMLLFALNVIKRECGNHTICESCPFSIIDEELEGIASCGIQDSIPNQWCLLDEEQCTEHLIF